jgi:hypothetical protein
LLGQMLRLRRGLLLVGHENLSADLPFVARRGTYLPVSLGGALPPAASRTTVFA